MNEKESKFLDWYLSTGDKEAAVKEAGYSIRKGKTAKGIASEVLSHKHIQDALKQRKAEMAKRVQISEEEIIQRMWEEALTAEKSSERQSALKSVREWCGYATKDGERDKGLIINITDFQRTDNKPEKVVKEIEHDPLPPNVKITDFSENQ